MEEKIKVNSRKILEGDEIEGDLGNVIQEKQEWGKGKMRKEREEEIDEMKRKKVEMVDNKLVNEKNKVEEGGKKVVKLKMVIEEKKIVIDDEGKEVNEMNLKGKVKGKIMVVNKEDYIEMKIIKKEKNKMLKKIDLNEEKGEMGGGGMKEINKGEKKVMRLKEKKNGVFVYK